MQTHEPIHLQRKKLAVLREKYIDGKAEREVVPAFFTCDNATSASPLNWSHARVAVEFHSVSSLWFHKHVAPRTHARRGPRRR